MIMSMLKPEEEDSVTATVAFMIAADVVGLTVVVALAVVVVTADVAVGSKVVAVVAAVGERGVRETSAVVCLVQFEVVEPCGHASDLKHSTARVTR
jgi:hypothetical protein